MSKEVYIGSIINGYKILKRVFKSLIPERSLYKVKCVLCGLISKKRLIDIKHESCKCKENTIVEEESKKVKNPRRVGKSKSLVEFDKTRMMDSIGVVRGKYVVVGFFFNDFDSDSPSMKRKTKRYIVKCRLCGELCIMSNNNLNRSKEKRDKNVKCNHKVFFDMTKYDPSDYYIDNDVLNYEK